MANCKAADCGKLQVTTTTKPTMSVLAAMSINASIPTFSFCGITNNEIPQGVLLRFYSRPCDTPLTDTSTNLTHSHSPGLGCSSGPMPSTAPFFWGRRQGALALKSGQGRTPRLAVSRTKCSPVGEVCFCEAERWVCVAAAVPRNAWVFAVF